MSKKTLDVLCIGLMCCDIIAKPLGKDIFDIDTHRLDTLKITSGGDALNAAVNMTKLGLKVALIGRTGKDMMGDFICTEAARFGVDIKYIKKSENTSTSTSIVLVEENGERHFAAHGSSNATLVPDDIDDNALKTSRIVHLGSSMALPGLDGKALADIFQKAKTAGAVTSMDATWDSSGKWLSRIDDALYHTDYFMPSILEAKQITGLLKTGDIAEFFRKYNLKTLVIKLGEEGCFVTNYQESFTIPAFRNVTAVDTTGAGDAFVSGFLTGIIRGLSLYDSAQAGNAVAALSVTQAGATTGVRDWNETMTFIESELGSGN